jgi:hypothetical protein
MDDHKLVMMFIFSWIFKTWEKYNFFMKICLENILGFGCMHENKIFFLFLKREINLKVLNFFWNISEKIEYFNTKFVFYSVNIQPDIM